MKILKKLKSWWNDNKFNPPHEGDYCYGGTWYACCGPIGRHAVTVNKIVIPYECEKCKDDRLSEKDMDEQASPRSLARRMYNF